MKLTNGKIAILVIFLVLFIDQFTKYGLKLTCIWVKISKSQNGFIFYL